MAMAATAASSSATWGAPGTSDSVPRGVSGGAPNGLYRPAKTALGTEATHPYTQVWRRGKRTPPWNHRTMRCYSHLDDAGCPTELGVPTQS